MQCDRYSVVGTGTTAAQWRRVCVQSSHSKPASSQQVETGGKKEQEGQTDGSQGAEVRW